MKTILDYKNLLLEKLQDENIPENKLSVKEVKKPKKKFLGWYRGMSQFSSAPIIYVDINLHKKELNENNENENLLDQVIMDTMLHEYGHVIEEFIRIDSRRTGNNKHLDELNLNFNDMEDFAELFAKYINHDVYIEEKQIKAIEELIDYYKKSTFTPKYLAWSQKPVWEKELQTLLKKFEKSSEKLKTVEGSFNKCLGTCESFYERMSEKSGVSILRAEGYKSDLINAHPKWKKFKSKEFMVHYVLCHNDKVIDLTAKQFNANANFPLIQSIEDFSKNWISVESFKSKINKTTKLKI